MRMHRWMTTFALAGALSLAACGDDAAPESRSEGADEAQNAAGYAPDDGQGTAVNDTVPHRPGTPEKH
jgi:hypothetical protein